MGLLTRLQHGWDAFMNKDPTGYRINKDYGWGATVRPDRPHLSKGNEKSIINAIYNRIAIDVSAVDFRHIRTDENGKYLEDLDTSLQNCLTVEANLDQTARAFFIDIVVSMFDEGHVVLVPTRTNVDIRMNDTFKIGEMRTGKVEKWFPEYVDIKLYNDITGEFVVQRYPKRSVAIIENPLYSVINEPNSTFQRLVRKLNLLDAVDAQNSSGKLDLIIQLPYVIKTEARRAEAERRRSEIEKQLSSSKYGIAYTDGTERITQLNRAVESNLMSQIEYLTNMLYSQLGITQAVMDGTADERTMVNYENRTIEPILMAITDEIKRKFLSKTARSQGQTIKYFRRPFRYATMADIAEFSDKLTRNEILSSNEIRQELGYKPSEDPKADELINSNIAHEEESETEESILDSELEQSSIKKTNILYHYGVKGMKWGQHIFGRSTDLNSKAHRLAEEQKYAADIEALVAKQSDANRKLLNLDTDAPYFKERDKGSLVKRIVVKDDHEAVRGFADIFDGDDEPKRSGDKIYGNVVICVDQEQQGRGYGKKLAKELNSWINDNIDSFEMVNWSARSNNPASNKLASYAGFREDESVDPDWRVYGWYPDMKRG